VEKYKIRFNKYQKPFEYIVIDYSLISRDEGKKLLDKCLKRSNDDPVVYRPLFVNKINKHF